MTKQQIIEELRKRGHGRIADLVAAEMADDEPKRDVPSEPKKKAK